MKRNKTAAGAPCACADATATAAVAPSPAADATAAPATPVAGPCVAWTEPCLGSDAPGMFCPAGPAPAGAPLPCYCDIKPLYGAGGNPAAGRQAAAECRLAAACADETADEAREIHRELVKARVRLLPEACRGPQMIVLDGSYCLPVALSDEDTAVVLMAGGRLTEQAVEQLFAGVDTLVQGVRPQRAITWVCLSFGRRNGRRRWRAQVCLPCAMPPAEREAARDRLLGLCMTANAAWLKDELAALRSRELSRDERAALLRKMETAGLRKIDTGEAVIRIRRRPDRLTVSMTDLRERYPDVFNALAVTRPGRSALSITRKSAPRP